jgi:hypothetical protein
MAAAVISVSLVLCWSGVATAQPPPQSQDRRPNLRGPNRPVTSPYLNLLGNQNQGFTFQYFRRVEPEVEFRDADTQLGQAVGQLRNEMRLEKRALSSTLRETGHRTTFLNYSGFYNIQSR